MRLMNFYSFISTSISVRNPNAAQPQTLIPTCNTESSLFSFFRYASSDLAYLFVRKMKRIFSSFFVVRIFCPFIIRCTSPFLDNIRNRDCFFDVHSLITEIACANCVLVYFSRIFVICSYPDVHIFTITVVSFMSTNLMTYCHSKLKQSPHPSSNCSS